MWQMRGHRNQEVRRQTRLLLVRDEPPAAVEQNFRLYARTHHRPVDVLEQVLLDHKASHKTDADEQPQARVALLSRRESQLALHLLPQLP